MRREQDTDAAPREPERPPAESTVLQLQRTAGNRAVSALLARQPAPADTAPKPADSKKAAQMTVGLGADDEFVIPVDTIQWQYEKAVTVSFGAGNPAVSDLYLAWEQGRRFATGFVSTRGQMARLTDVTIQSMSHVTTGDEPVAVMSLLAEDVKLEPV